MKTNARSLPAWIFSTFACLNLMAAAPLARAEGAPSIPPAKAAAKKPDSDDDDPDASASPEPTGLPPELTDPNSLHVLAEKCQSVLKDWTLVRNEARAELAACNLHRFNDACLRLAAARKKVVGKDSPCMRIKDAKEKIAQIPEVNCNIVQVPQSCSR
jgi:hypothetical protein